MKLYEVVKYSARDHLVQDSKIGLSQDIDFLSGVNQRCVELTRYISKKLRTIYRQTSNRLH